MFEKPNLLFIYADGLRYDALGCNGNSSAYTPCLDALAGESVVFDNAVSGHPLETPYAASLFTGKYSVETGAVINELRLPHAHVTFADVLTENGYEASFFGRWHLYAAQLGHYFNTKNSFVPAGDDRMGFNGVFNVFNGSGELFAPKSYYHSDSPVKNYSKGFEPDFQTELAIEQLEKYGASRTPFALFLSFCAPAGIPSPDNTPREYFEMFKNTSFPIADNYSEKNDPHADIWSRFFGKDRNDLEAWKRCTYAMTAAVDADIGKLVNSLRKNGLLDNTVIVFTSSRGEMFGSHGRRSANIFYEEAVRVPFIVKHGNRFCAKRIKTCINTPDIMPTVLSLLGLPIPEGVSGVDLRSVFADGGEAVENDVLMTGTGPAAVWGDGREWRALRTEKYTYAVYLSGGEEYLFDNIADPCQLNNLASDGDYSDILSELKEKMLDRMNAIGDTFEKNSFYKKNWVNKRKIKADKPTAIGRSDAK